MRVRLEHVTHTYSPTDESAAVQVLEDVSLEIRSGEFAVLRGASGSGKSTLLNLIGAVDRPSSGRVFLGDDETSAMSEAQLTNLRRVRLGFVFQFFNLLPMLTAEENVLLPLSIAGEKPDRKWLDELMAKTGLRDRAKHRPSELSGGQQQRVAIARALVSKPSIVFADEPTGNLDSKTSGEILDLMRDTVDTFGQTTVMVTHEARAAATADRILFLADGLIVEERRDTTAADVVTVMQGLDS
jgi:putative ABC transport system ATP-binding protein